MFDEIPPPIPKKRRDRPSARQPIVTQSEAEKAWAELVRLDILCANVDQWRAAGYFKPEMETLDPVRAQRERAQELRQQLEYVPRVDPPQTVSDQIDLLSFLIDQVDLMASRDWFKSKAEMEKALMPIMAAMLELVSGNAPQ